MAKKDIKFTLDTIDSRYSPVGTVKQLDSVFFYIKITENGVTKDLTGQTIKLFAIKEDKKIVEQTNKINITNQREGLVEIELLNVALQVHGFTYFELEISDSNGIISTSDFILRVNKRVGSNEAIESTNEVATLKKIEEYVAQAKVELQNFKKLQTSMLETNNSINAQEVSRTEAERLRVEAEKGRVAAETKREEAFKKNEGRINANLHNLIKMSTSYSNGIESFMCSKWEKVLSGNITITVFNLCDKQIRFQTSKNLDGSYGRGISILKHSKKVITLNSDEKFRDVLGSSDDGWRVDNLEDLNKFKNGIVILEGNVEIDSVSFFEGIKSFGEEEGNKISSLSYSKNLIDGTKFEDNTLYFMDTGKKGTDRNYKAFSVNIIPNTNYYLTINSTGIIQIALYKNGIWKHGFYNKKTQLINGDYDEIKISVVKEGFINVQLEEGTKKTTYEPYKCDKKDILLQEPLREGDYLYEDNRQVKVYRDVKQYTFTGDEDITTHEQVNGLTRFRVVIPNNSKIGQLTIKFCDNLKINSDDRYFSNITMSIGTIVAEYQTNNNCYIIFNSETTTIEQAKAKLKEINPTIIYQLAKPTTKVVENCENINLKTFDEKTYIDFENALRGTNSFKVPVNTLATISRLNKENRALEEENLSLRQDLESTTLALTDSDLELVKQNVDMDFRLMEVEFALDIPQAILSSDIKFKNKKGEVKTMARTPYEMMKIVILSGDYDREDYMHKVGKYYERGRMTKEEYDELMSLMTADEVLSK